MILAVPLFAIVKIVLENIEETRPIAILLSERAPTLEEAWQDALKDGNLSSGEFAKLSELQKRLGVSDEKVSRIASRSAAQTVMRRGRARADEVEFILSAVAERPQFSELMNEISVGKISKDARVKLEELIETLNEECEEE